MKRLLTIALFSLLALGIAQAQNAKPCTNVTNTAASGQVLSAARAGSTPPCTWVAAGSVFTTIANPGLFNETLTYRNSIATTGVTNYIVKAGAANASGGNPYMFQVQNAAGTVMLGTSPLGTFVPGHLYFCDENVTFPCQFIFPNSESALDFVSTYTTANAGHGAFNIEQTGNATATSGTQAYMWISSNTRPFFAPTSGTAVYNGVWLDFGINQTGGANGITRGLYVANTITAAADYRGIEIADVGTTMTALKTGNGNVTLGGPVTTPLLNFGTTENGANNAIACAAGCGPTLTSGMVVTIKLAHTLQAGANTFAYAGGGALNIKSHNNVANNIAAAYASGGLIQLGYDGTQWEDMSQ